MESRRPVIPASLSRKSRLHHPLRPPLLYATSMPDLGQVRKSRRVVSAVAAGASVSAGSWDFLECLLAA